MGKQYYCLYAACLREHVYWLYRYGLIAQLIKDAQVAGQCAWISGNILDALRSHAGNVFQDFFGAAFAGRIDADDIRLAAFGR